MSSCINNLSVQFKNIGYHVDYYSNGKYIGSIKLTEKDREEVGYNGRIYHTATENIILGKKTIKKGESYYTELIPLCGRIN